MPFGHNELMQQNRFEVAKLISFIVEWNAWRNGSEKRVMNPFGQQPNRFGRMAGA